MSQTSLTTSILLCDHWSVQPVPLEMKDCPQAIPGSWISIDRWSHLQPLLYPDRPYWGEHLRAVNDQAWVFQRVFTKPIEAYKRARLRFEGVDYFAKVWINQKFAGEHEGHFTPFDLDITPFLDNENTVVTVLVSAPWDTPNPTGTYPTDHVIRGMVKGLYEHGEGMIPPRVNPLGIWRPVWLRLDEGISIDHIRIRACLDGTVDLRFRLTNSTGELWNGKLEMSVSAINHDGQGVQACRSLALPPGTHCFDHKLYIPDVRWWWSWDQGMPDLYQLTTQIVSAKGQIFDSQHENFGVRTVRLDRTPQRFTYWLNERPVFVRGSSYMPALYLSQCDTATFAHDISLAQQANLNLLRLHVHVSPPELYDLCDRRGMLIWQDFELNWIHDASTQFEERACRMQHEMIELLGNHPSIITWACHNEPTMVFSRRQNLEAHPDPALYRDAQEQDPTRPVFLCSGQMESDWQRSGDSHSYYGALWSRQYTDIYAYRTRLATEFGFEAPATLETLRIYPEVWKRLDHLDGQIDSLWAYQAALIQYQVEHFRRLRAECCGGYIHFWLADLVPQVGCGVLDACRVPKGGYEALCRASQPLLPALEHNGCKPIALWVFNDTACTYGAASLRWQIFDGAGQQILEGSHRCDLVANASQRITSTDWEVNPASCATIKLQLISASGEILSENAYSQPFRPQQRPRAYPWKFDTYLGTKVFDRPDAASLAEQSTSPILKIIPLGVREVLAEWILRQRVPVSLLSRLAHIVDSVMN